MNYKPIKHHSFIASLQCRTPYSVSDSCCEPLSLEELLTLSGEGLPIRLPLNYASISGHPALRAAVANLYSGWGVNKTPDADKVAVFSGAQEALFAAFNAVLKPGDEVIIPTPCYPSLLEMPSLIGAKAVALPLSFQRGWCFAIEDFKLRISVKTKMIVINSPHNPTGSLAESKFSKELLELVREKGIYLLSDDVSVFSDFNDINLGHGYLDYDRAIIVGVLSKSFGLGGVRIGWAISDNEMILRDMLTVKCYGSICTSALDEYLARIAIENIAVICHRNNAIISRNIDVFESFLSDIGSLFAWRKPKGGIMTLVKTELKMPLHQFARSLAQSDGILMLPGDLFGIDGDYFRLGLGRKNLPDVLEKLKLRLFEH